MLCDDNAFASFPSITSETSDSVIEMNNLGKHAAARVLWYSK